MSIGRGNDILRTLVGQARSGTVKRQVRRGYGSSEIQFSGKGLASRLGLGRGERISRSNRSATNEIVVETSGRVVLSVRQHDRQK